MKLEDLRLSKLGIEGSEVMSFSDKSSGAAGGDSQSRKSGNLSADASSYQRTNSGSGKPSVGGGGLPGSYQRPNSNRFWSLVYIFRSVV